MLNTNGLRIAIDEKFVQELAQFEGKFEVYLQFDGFAPKTHTYFRGRDLSEIKTKAIANLTKNNLPITLVSTLKRGVNDNEIGEIIKFGLDTTGIRGVNFQPVAYFGRLPKTKSANSATKETGVKTEMEKNERKNRITLSGVVKEIETQLPDVFQKGDIIPLPCNVERNAVSFLIRGKNDQYVSVVRKLNIAQNLSLINNTFAFDLERILNKENEKTAPEKEAGAKKEKKGFNCGCNCLSFLGDFKKIIPADFLLKSKKAKINYVNENVFRISVTSFVDKYNFDLKSMQKECVHVITPDFKCIPFSAYNMFYRK